MQGSSRNRSAGDQPDSFEEALGKERGVRAGQLIDELTALVFEADPDGAAVITVSCRDENMSGHPQTQLRFAPGRLHPPP